MRIGGCSLGCWLPACAGGCPDTQETPLLHSPAGQGAGTISSWLPGTGPCLPEETPELCQASQMAFRQEEERSPPSSPTEPQTRPPEAALPLQLPGGALHARSAWASLRGVGGGQ